MEEVDVESSEKLGSNTIMGYIELTPPSEALASIASLPIGLSNLPPIPQGKIGIITNAPATPGFKLRRENDLTLNIPRGCSFATIIIPKDNNIEVKDGDVNNRYLTVLIDSNGMAFLGGFAFFIEKSVEAKNFNGINEIFQTIDGEALDLVTTISIPNEAIEGNAKIEILGDNIPLITVPTIIIPKDNNKVQIL